MSGSPREIGPRRFRVLGALIIAAALSMAVGAASAFGPEAAKPRGLTPDDYASLYLTAADLPAGMRQTQDSKAMKPDPDDAAYGRLGGVRTGLTVWTPEDEDKSLIGRLVDIRWVLPTEAAAKEHLASCLASQSEGTPPVAEAPKVGQECHVYGGKVAAAEALGLKMRSYIYLFRVRNVNVKLFASGPDEQDRKLSPLVMAAIARKIARRIDRDTPAPSPAPAPASAPAPR